MSKLIKVLSIDGGGIRGVIPAMILAEIEHRTQKSISDLFDLIAGTSTGGILALGLTKPDSNGKPEFAAKDLVSLYEEHGKRIFNRSQMIPEGILPIFKRKFSARGLEAVLNEYFGETRLSEALKDVLISSYEIELRQLYFFKSNKAKQDSNRNFKMKDVARATSAAPTYFEPLKLETPDGLSHYALIDGGVFINNPAMSAYVEAKNIDTNADVVVVSLGTGELTTKLPYEKVKRWGMLEWARPILNVTFDGVSDAVDYQLRELLPNIESSHQCYYRFQTHLHEIGDHMDDARPEQIQNLKGLATKIIQEKDSTINTLCQQLLQSVSVYSS